MPDNDLIRRVELLEQFIAAFSKSDRYIIARLLQFNDGRNIQLGKSTGTKIGTETTQKLSFYGVAPVAQQSSITAPSGGSTVDSQARTAISTIISTIKNTGLTA